MNQKQFDDIQQLNTQICQLKKNFDNLYNQFQRIVSQEISNSRQSQNFTINSKIKQQIVSFSNIYQDQRNNCEIFNIYNDSQLQNKDIDEKRGKYKKYSQQLKQKAIDYVKKENISPKIVCQKLNIPLKNLLRWMQIGAIRKKGGGRKIQDKTMELELKQWIIQRLQNGNTLAARDIKKMAKKLINPQFQQSFKASKGWLEKFLKRNNILNIKGKNHFLQPVDQNVSMKSENDDFNNNILNYMN